MTNGAATPDDAVKLSSQDVQTAVVLDAGLLADDDVSDVPAQDRTRPNGGSFSEPNPPDHARLTIDVNALS